MEPREWENKAVLSLDRAVPAAVDLSALSQLSQQMPYNAGVDVIWDSAVTATWAVVWGRAQPDPDGKRVHQENSAL